MPLSCPPLSFQFGRTCLVTVHVSLLMLCPGEVAVGSVLPWIWSDMLDA